MSDSEVIIDVGADTKPAEEDTKKILKKIGNVKANISLQLEDNNFLKLQLTNIRDTINSIGKPPPEIIQVYNEMFNQFELGQQKIFQLRNELKELNSEYSKLAVSKAPQIQANGFSVLGENIQRVKNSVNDFRKRLFSILKAVFVFNVLSRGFRHLYSLIGGLVSRDAVLAKTFVVIRANMIRAFAPVWKHILPIIRLLGEGIVWLTNQLIRFINFVTGSKIKPLNVGDWKEAKQVVGNFYKEISPKKEMFPEINISKQVQPTKKISKNAKTTKNNIKRANKSLEKTSKEVNKVLASFDKLEVLDLSKKFGFDGGEDDVKRLQVNVDKPNIESQISNAIDSDYDPIDLDVKDDLNSQIAEQINNMVSPPLEFDVNDNINDQITEQINGLELPALSFEVDKETEEKVENLRKKLKAFEEKYEAMIRFFEEHKTAWKIVSDGIIAIGGALVVANIAKKIGLITTLFSGPGGIAAIIGASAGLIISHFKDIQWAFGKLVDGARWAFEKISNLLSKIKLLNPFSKSGYSIETNFSSASVPHLAQGSILRGGDPFLAFVNDQPRGQTNVEAPLETIVDAFKTALSDSQLNRQPQINISSSGSMSEFIRMLNLKIENEQLRTGKNFVRGI